MASIDRTAYPRFKRVVSARELAEAFAPTPDEAGWARGRTQNDQHFLALVVLLKCYQRLGYFPKLTDVPAVVVDHVRGKLDLADGVKAEADAERTGKRHRQFVRDRLGVKCTPAAVRAVAEAAIRKAVQSKDNPAHLINVALDELVRQSCELPGYTTLDAMAASIRTEVNAGMFTTVAARPHRMQRARLERLLLVDPATRRSEFDRLKDSARAATLGKFKDRLAHLASLEPLDPTEQWLDGVPPGKVAHFAGEARVTDAADMRKVLNDDKRLALLVSLVHECRTSARDEVVTMFCKRMAALHKKGRERLEEIQAANRAETERLIGGLGDVVAAAREATAVADPDPGTGEPGQPAEGLEERTGRLVLKTLADAGGIDALAGAAVAVSAYHGNNYLPLLERFYRSHRPVLFTLVDAIELEAVGADRSVLDAVEFIRANRDRRSDWIPEMTPVEVDGEPPTTVSVDVDAFPSDVWRKVLRDRQRPGMLARRHLEVCVFSYLAAELRSGDIAVAGSDSYANLHAQLMTCDECQPLAADFCAQAVSRSTRPRWWRTTARADPHRRDRGRRVPGKHRPGAGRRAAGAQAPQGRRPAALGNHAGGGDPPAAARMQPSGHPDPHRVPDRLAPPLRPGIRVGPEDPRHARPRRHHALRLRHHPRPGRGRPAHARQGQRAGDLHGRQQALQPHQGYRGSTDVINEFAKLDVPGIWGDGQVVAVDGSQVDTWKNNLLAESHIRYGGYGGRCAVP